MTKDKIFTNHLKNASSPYLLQHANNPVDWYEWGEEAIARAKNEDKLIIVSVGYSACHWCHVMAHQSFEDEEVAALMNKHFVSIKVDREERPDIDQIYMLAAHLSTGHGGWPLNAFALPDGRPFYAGTYFPKEEWINMLAQIVDMYKSKRNDLTGAADSLTKGIAVTDEIAPNQAISPFTINDLDQAVTNWLPQIDREKGGDKGPNINTPKFPMPNNWEFLMQYAQLSENEAARKAVITTLDAMALGGIYDQVGGGFTRYSTDQNWQIPHFEKMLYDNAQLIKLYSAAYQWTKNELYKSTVYQSVEWLEREMTSREYGFFSALDADSEGQEGKFYVWTFAELQNLAGEDWPILSSYYNVTRAGNFEGKNNLNRAMTIADFSGNTGLPIPELIAMVDKFNARLLAERSSRVRPGLDDKIITSWNALMISGLVQSYRAFDDEKFLDLASRNAGFLLKNVITSDGKVKRIYKDGQVSISGFLDDYSFTTEAFIDLYMATFEENWLHKAHVLLQYARDHFFDSRTGMFYYTSDLDQDLIARKMEISDNVISSSNSSQAHALFKLGHLLNKSSYVDLAKTMVNNVKSQIIANPRFYANWASLYQNFVLPPFEVAIVGPRAQQTRAAIDKEFIPNMLVLGGKNEGSLELLKGKMIENQTTIYVCQNKTCDLPTTDTEQAINTMKNS